jgi:nitroimidazol reductase NimA-like FMN-containing flavoprotein (pyridoxamine 5'-phosphate oxidase superfamily)
VSASDAPLQTGDLARRVARRRAELGKSIETVASAVGIDPGYLRYFEESPGVRLSTGTMLLLALALECTPEELYGARVDRPPGRGRAGRHPELSELTEPQCDAHLHAGGVGRVVLVADRGPVAHPMNFAVSEGDVFVSTTVEQAAQLEAQAKVSFQIDRADESMSEGWSVLVTGSARRVDDPDELVALAHLGLAPWAGGPRHALVRIHPDETTGRVIVQAVAPAEAY